MHHATRLDLANTPPAGKGSAPRSGETAQIPAAAAINSKPTIVLIFVVLSNVLLQGDVNAVARRCS